MLHRRRKRGSHARDAHGGVTLIGGRGAEPVGGCSDTVDNPSGGTESRAENPLSPINLPDNFLIYSLHFLIYSLRFLIQSIAIVARLFDLLIGKFWQSWNLPENFDEILKFDDRALFPGQKRANMDRPS